MAARIEPASRVSHLQLVDLRRLASLQLDALLDDEVRLWREELDWDFTKSAELVRRFVDLRALSGCALMDGSDAVGYCYYVLEEQKGLIGDLYLRRGFQTAENEDLLLGAALDGVISSGQVTRVEAQLILLGERGPAAPLAPYLASFERNFMALDLRRSRLEPVTARRSIHLERWASYHQEGAAHLIAAAYQGHIDGQINDQYRSVEGARRFLYNIVQFPGCGAFFQPASFVAFDMETGRQCGISLASRISPNAGHITQVCVSPAVRGTGAGYELLRHTAGMLREHGMNSVSLTVTAGNQSAVGLYERMGFRTRRRFQALVWEGFA
ncbi:MAG: GNAT family N-acetyltransferase [Candidatus Solibacter usitatus]|nr:GNAT family N-acetyltransferase [Candidatus Solibacter usitatus]